MPAPTRFPQGISNAAPWQFFAGMGLPNPFFYHQFADDFDTVPSATVGWTLSGTGTAPLSTTLDGGNVVLTTTAVAAEFESIQRTAPSFIPASGKKMYFVARISLSDVVNAGFVAGLMPITGTPFVNPANGIWISKASGSSVINLNVANNSVVTTTAFPTTAITLTNNVSFDVGFHVTGGASGNAATVNASFAGNLVGYNPQSGTGTPGSTNRAPNIATTATLLTTLQATPLAPVVACLAGTTTIKTMPVDFVGAFRER